MLENESIVPLMESVQPMAARLRELAYAIVQA